MYIHKSYKFRILEVNIVNKIHAGRILFLQGAGGNKKLAVIYT